jgi:hypothetical protein
MNILKWVVAAGIAGGTVYAISQGNLTASNGKFLGLFEEKDGFDLSDVAKGGVILGVAAVAGMLVHKIGGPAAVVRAA